METNFPNIDSKDIIESQLREIYGRVVWTHKVHEKEADILLNIRKWIKRIEIILSSLTTGSLVYLLFGNSKIGNILGALFSTVLLGLILYTKEEKMQELIQSNSLAAKRLLAIRERLLSLLTDLKANVLSLKQICYERDLVLKELDQIYKEAPRTSKKAYKEAGKALKIDEEMTFSDSEIDKFLPKPLRKTED